MTATSDAFKVSVLLTTPADDVGGVADAFRLAKADGRRFCGLAN